ncbi:MAG: hypothetical protein AAFU77_14260 [Myxococcota bacterium]
MLARNIWVVYGLVFAVVFVGWLLWSSPGAGPPKIQGTFVPPDQRGDFKPKSNFKPPYERQPNQGLVRPLVAGPGPSSRAQPADGLPTPPVAGTDQLPDHIPPFSAPGDGRLSQDHIDMFIRIAGAARKSSARRLDDLSLQWAEARAAESLGYDPKGYRWVQARIHLALAADQRRQQVALTRSLREKMLAEVEQMRAEAKSENERVIIDQQLKDMLPPAADTLPPETEVERSNRETVMANLPELQSAMGVGEEAARSPRLQVIEEDENGEVETEEVLLPAPSEENP